MVQRRHLEHPLAVRQLEVAHLNDIGQRFTDVDEAHQNQHQRHVVGKSQRRHRAAQKQGAGVAHEHLGGIVVIQQKAHQTPEQRRAEQTQLSVIHRQRRQHQILGHIAAALPREESCHRQRDAAGQAVDPVGDVDGVDGAHDDEGGEHQIHTPA